MTNPHIGPSGYRPGDFGYEFDCTLADCTLRYHLLDHRDPTPGVLEIVPPEGKVAHLVIGAQVKTIPAMVAGLTLAEAFMAGFEGDETQEGIAGNLATIRAAIALATNGTPLPADPVRDAAGDMLAALKDLHAWASRMGGWEAPCWQVASVIMARAAGWQVKRLEDGAGERDVEFFAWKGGSADAPELETCICDTEEEAWAEAAGLVAEGREG
jgi:hypothetical protein